MLLVYINTANTSVALACQLGLVHYYKIKMTSIPPQEYLKTSLQDVEFCKAA